MTTRMIHPEHGATHAYGIVDIEWHQKNGWVIESEQPKAPPLTLPVLDEPPRRRPILKVKK